MKNINLNKNTKIYTCSSVGIDYFFFLGKTLKDAGFTVEEIFLISESDYRKQAKSNGFSKVSLRFKMYIAYPLLLIYKALTVNGNNIFIVSSNTFYAPLVVKLFASKQTKVINLVYDLFPDAIEVASKLKSNGFVSKLIGKITTWNMELTNANVFLGDVLKNHALKRWSNNNKNPNKAIHISADYELFKNEINTNINLEDPIVFHYGGQLGHLHDAESIVLFINQMIKEMDDSKYKFIFNLSGANANYIESKINNPNLIINGAIPSHLWRQEINNYQIGIVTLSPGGATVCLPSKTYAMMGGGLAIIAICPIWSDLAKLVNGIDGGWVINNSFYDDLDEIPKINFSTEINRLRSDKDLEKDIIKTISTIFNDANLIEEKRKNAYEGVRKKIWTN